MPLTPFAQAQMSIAGGGNVVGGQVIAGNQSVQLSGVSTSGWVTQLWEIPAFPVGFATPAGWTLVNGVLQSSAVTPPVFTVPAAAVTWGKYLFRLTVNGGLLNGVLMGPLSAQPLIDIASGVDIRSPKGQRDIALLEGAQFNAAAQWIGEYQANLRIIEAQLGGGGGGTLPVTDALVTKTANYTIVASTDYHVAIGQFTSGVTITLPASPANGNKFVVTNNGSGVNSVSGNGNTINVTGSTTTSLAVKQSVTFVWSSADSMWLAA